MTMAGKKRGRSAVADPRRSRIVRQNAGSKASTSSGTAFCSSLFLSSFALDLNMAKSILNGKRNWKVIGNEVFGCRLCTNS